MDDYKSGYARILSQTSSIPILTCNVRFLFVNSSYGLSLASTTSDRGTIKCKIDGTFVGKSIFVDYIYYIERDYIFRDSKGLSSAKVVFTVDEYHNY